MPFTLSHMIVAAPINKLSRGKLPLAALAIGSMTPDLYRLFTTSNIGTTHQWSSVLSYNLVLGSLITLCWYCLYRPVLFRFFNLAHPLRLDSTRDYFSFSLVAAIAIMLGASTHILWDGLTHLDDRTYAFYNFLSQNIHLGSFTYPVHRVLQIFSSIIALPPLLWMLRSYILRHQRTRPSRLWIQHYAWGLMCCSLFAGLLGYYLFNQNFNPELIRVDLYYYIGRSLNQFASYFLTIFTVGCILFKSIDIKRVSTAY